MAATPETTELQKAVEPLLRKVKISTLRKPPLGRVETLSDNMTLREAVEFLHSKGILSAPVVKTDAASDASWEERYLGVVDMIAMCTATIEAFSSGAAASAAIKEESEADEDLQTTVLAPLPAHFDKERLSEITDGNSWFPFLPIEEGDTLYDAVQLLGTLKIRRVPVLSPDGQVVNILTQSSVVAELAEHVKEYAPLAKKSLDDLGLGAPQTVFSISREQPVKAAFKLIAEKNISGVPVLGADGAVIGNISARHIFFVISARNKMRLLGMSAAAFLRRIADIAVQVDLKATAITCQGSDSLASVLMRLAAAKVHRIFVVDAAGRPIRVLSLSDVLNRFVTTSDEVPCEIQ